MKALRLFCRLQMKTMDRLRAVIVLSLSICVTVSRAQTTVLPEIGVSYITNDVDKPDTRLYDFLAFTINTRILLAQGGNYSFSLDVPLSIRSKSKDDRTTKFGLMMPALGMFNYGAGAVSEPNKNSLGFTAGLGMAYFHQRTQSEKNEMPQYKESLSSAGPILQAGIRIPGRKTTLFRYKEKSAYPVYNVKFSYLMNMEESQKNIGAVSFLVGLGF
jgi:hypothetical protein